MRSHDLVDLVKIAILNMPSVFTKMNRNAVGAGFLGHDHRLGWARIRGPARLAQRRDMVDIDAEVEGGRIHGAILDHYCRRRCNSTSTLRVLSSLPPR